MSSSSASTQCAAVTKKLLPPNFVPTPFTVICGRGKQISAALGNQRLKGLINSYMKQYSEALTRLEKSSIVSTIVAMIKQASPQGGFVKFEQGQWWEMDDSVAREKVGCLLRDRLHSQYRSSSKAKMAKRRALKAAMANGTNQNIIDGSIEFVQSSDTATSQTVHLLSPTSWGVGSSSNGGNDVLGRNALKGNGLGSIDPRPTPDGMKSGGGSASFKVQPWPQRLAMKPNADLFGKLPQRNAVSTGRDVSLLTAHLDIGICGGLGAGNDGSSPATNVATLMEEAFGILRNGDDGTMSTNEVVKSLNGPQRALQGDLLRPSLSCRFPTSNRLNSLERRVDSDDLCHVIGDDIASASCETALCALPLDDNFFDD